MFNWYFKTIDFRHSKKTCPDFSRGWSKTYQKYKRQIEKMQSYDFRAFAVRDIEFNENVFWPCFGQK